MVVSDDGKLDFHALRTRRNGHAVVLYAFDLIGHDGDDLCSLSLLQRKRRLAKLLGKSQRRAVRFVEHLTGDGPTIFHHACRMGLEGIVSKRTDAPYRSGPSKVWLKSKNPASEAVRREREEEWHYALHFPVDQDRRIRLIEEIPQLHNKRILDPRLDIAFKRIKAHGRSARMNSRSATPSSNPDTPRDNSRTI